MICVVPLELREMGPEHRHYVLSSWIKSYAAKGRDAHDYADRRELSADYANVVRSLVERSRIVVATLDGNPDIIAGWMAWEGETLHYLLTKPAFRRMGVASWMVRDFAEMPVQFTHMTKDASRFPIPSGWAYRRYRIWPPQETAA